MRPATLAVILALGACTQFPDLDSTIPPGAERADFPALVPLDPLLAQNIASAEDNDAISASLEARVAALRARARSLQTGSIVDPATRQRLTTQLN